MATQKSGILAALNTYVEDHELELRSVTIPEITDADGEPITIYAREMTMAKFNQIQKMVGRNAAEGETLIATAVCCFLDDRGLRLFRNKSDAKALHRLHPNLLARMVGDLNLGEEPEDEDETQVDVAEKKSVTMVS